MLSSNKVAKKKKKIEKKQLHVCDPVDSGIIITIKIVIKTTATTV